MRLVKTTALLAGLLPTLICAALPSAEETAFFESKVRPLLIEQCYECHSESAKKVKGGLLLDSKSGWEKGGDSGDPIIVPGSPEESALIKAVRHDDADSAMPPKKPKLPDAAIADLIAWVKMGAPDPRVSGTGEAKRADKSWWSLQPLAHIEPPSPAGLPEAWAANPVDRFIFAKMAEKGLAPSPPADARTLIRRMSYDLTGLPPSADEVAAFEKAHAADPRAAIEALADRLLASPRYGEQWGRHWLDVVRFGESNGFERNFIINDLWPFRDYVIRSFNEDRPFNQVITEHLAGDVVAKDNPSIEVACAFLVAGPYDDVGNQDVAAQKNIRAATLDDIITATGSAFLGLTVNCARCHNHKFDPIPTEDYYRLRAAFEGVAHGRRVVASKQERERFAVVTQPLNEQLEKLNAELTAHREITTAEEKQKLDVIAREITQVRQKLDAIPPLRQVWVGNFSQPKERTFVHKGGDPAKPGEAVLPASLSVLDRVTKPYELTADAPEGERRLALAKWIVSDDNPLTPRVLANRLWHYHFGTGIVDTPSDFGFFGGRPTHHELLDWLAARLQQNGWRLKKLQREIVLSQTYRQSSASRDDAARVDKDARYLWRFPPRRLSAEELRDTILSAAGKLQLAPMGGPGFRLYKVVENNVSTYYPLDVHGPETYRRAVYHQNARASIVDMLNDFDFPDIAFAAPRRTSTTTPLQALTLLNHRFTLEMSAALAAHAGELAASKEPSAIIDSACRLTLQRTPSEQERAAAASLITAHGLPAFCRALLNLNELLYLE